VAIVRQDVGSGRRPVPPLVDALMKLATMILLAILLGALGGLLAAGSTWPEPAQMTLSHDARALVIVQSAWQGARPAR
jgi:hypothetical protein